MEAQKLEILRAEASQQSLGMSHPDIYECASDLLIKNNIQMGSILDVGAGVGDFIRLMQKKTNCKLYGVDLMHSQVPGVEWYVQDLNRNLQFQNEKFHAITCLEVLEHVENPRKLVREIFRVLKPGGHLVLSTPNNHSWRAIISYIFREHFVAFTESSYPAHITAINKADIQRMCLEAGFMNLEIKFTDRGCLPKWTNLTWQDVSGNLLKGMRYSDNIICIAQKPFIAAV
ncbi:MAG: methyltransferase domain-containing protein [Bdellovibrionaceae bacterium]|nr:methyltransferase domain-containing protein [Pseudobdellovibrionaceae bacterium]